MSLYAVKVRPFAADDWLSVMAIERDCFATRERWPKRLYKKHLAEGGQGAVLTEGDLVVAVCWWDKNEIVSLGTRLGYRGYGYARRLLNNAIAQIAQDTRGYVCVGLEVRPKSVAALNMYFSMGFTAKAWLPNYYGRGKGGLLMERRF